MAVCYDPAMNTTTTGRSPLASLALRIGEVVSIQTSDGFRAVVRIVDVRSSYGSLQVSVVQNEGDERARAGRWVDANRLAPRGWDKVTA